MNSCIDLWGESTGLYFFSAVFQGNMALLALIGVFVVFKIQQLNSLIIQLNDIMVKFVRDNFSVRKGGLPIPFLYKIDEDVVEIFDALKNYIKDHHDAKDTVQSLENNEHLNKLYNQGKSYSVQKNKFKTEMKLPIILTLFVIIVSLICLPFIHKIHYSWMLLEIYLITITILLNIVALFLNIKFIIKAVKNS